MVGNQKPVAVAMHADASGGVFAIAGGRGEMAGIELDEFAARGESVERGFDGVALFAANPEVAEKCFRLTWPRGCLAMCASSAASSILFNNRG